jgi:hypothetical protein
MGSKKPRVIGRVFGRFGKAIYDKDVGRRFVGNAYHRPHQGKREVERRRRRIEAGKAPG